MPSLVGCRAIAVLSFLDVIRPFAVSITRKKTLLTKKKYTYNICRKNDGD